MKQASPAGPSAIRGPSRPGGSGPRPQVATMHTRRGSRPPTGRETTQPIPTRTATTVAAEALGTQERLRNGGHSMPHDADGGGGGSGSLSKDDAVADHPRRLGRRAATVSIAAAVMAPNAVGRAGPTAVSHHRHQPRPDRPPRQRQPQPAVRHRPRNHPRTARRTDPRPARHRPPLHRRRFPRRHALAVPRPQPRTAPQRRQARCPPRQTRHRWTRQPTNRTHPARRRGPRRRPVRTARLLQQRRRHLDPRRRRQLVTLRRRPRPTARSPTCRMTSRNSPRRTYSTHPEHCGLPASPRRAGGTTSRSSASGSVTARWPSRSTHTHTCFRQPTRRSRTRSRARSSAESDRSRVHGVSTACPQPVTPGGVSAGQDGFPVSST